MSGGLTLIPSYTSDNLFPAYQDRLLVKSLGIQAGVSGEEDYKVSAGTGLQVNVKSGKAFVEQSFANLGTFYNGLYNILNPTEQSPYNGVEVSSANPQIAQIILRVYDVEELRSVGSSYARIEWLNGSPNVGATKAHVEEGKASEFGATALTSLTSVLRIAYVVVPKNATVSSEYSIIDARSWISKGAWVTLSLSSKLEAIGSVASVQIRQDTPGVMRLRGNAAIKVGQELKIGEEITKIPLGYRPAHEQTMTINQGTATPQIAEMLIASSGVVALNTVTAPSTAILRLDGLTFPTTP